MLVASDFDEWRIILHGPGLCIQVIHGRPPLRTATPFAGWSILERMTEMLWVGLPILISVVCVLAYFLMKARMEAAIARERVSLAETRAGLEAQAKTLTETIRATEEEAKRQALDEFLGDLHVEERHYLRQQKVLFLSKKSLVLRERIFFRNIPLSSWVEHEISIDEGADVESLAKTLTVFSPELMLSPSSDGRKSLR